MRAGAATDRVRAILDERRAIAFGRDDAAFQRQWAELRDDPAARAAAPGEGFYCHCDDGVATPSSEEGLSCD